jgi:tetratricopeptide (TPR) repeat protein
MSALPPTDPHRPAHARLARIHLRAGLVALARAELETMAGMGELDGPALADLAEARWRTGDLPGAGEAAHAHLDGGGDEPIAYVVAAEADEARGRVADARELVAKVENRADISLADFHALSGGRVRAPIWSHPDAPTDLPPPAPRAAPPETPRAAAPAVAAPAPSVPSPATPTEPSAVEAGAAEAGDQTPSVAPAPPARQKGRRSRRSSGSSGKEAPATATLFADETAATSHDADAGSKEGPAGAGEPVAEDAAAAAAARLALQLRDRSIPAPMVLDLANEALAALSAAEQAGPAGAALHLVRGDAYRQMGREQEATEAYQACWSTLERSVPADEGSPPDEASPAAEEAPARPDATADPDANVGPGTTP